MRAEHMRLSLPEYTRAVSDRFASNGYPPLPGLTPRTY
jgi:hypothetical protein